VTVQCTRYMVSAVLRLKKASPTAADGLSADSFSAAFTARTDSIRSCTVSAPGPVFDDLAKECQLDAFELIDDTTVQRLSSHMQLTRTASSIRLQRGS